MNAEWSSERTVSIPLSEKLADNDLDDVIDSVQTISTMTRSSVRHGFLYVAVCQRTKRCHVWIHYYQR